MQALVPFARGSSLLQALPSFQQQGIVTWASSTQSERGGEIVHGANAQAPQKGEVNVVSEAPPFRVPGLPERRYRREKQPYELSVFSALDLPARSLASAVTFSYLGYVVAPTSIGAHYLTQIWSGATVISAIWFAYRWKSNAFARMLTGKTMTNQERERYLTMDRLSSIGLFVLGGMAFAGACGVAVQSILTVRGIGGVATAFAARDILGNMLSEVSLQFSRPFIVGDSISAGSVNGQVVEMGLHTTQLLNSDKFPIVVPNSFFSNQLLLMQVPNEATGEDVERKFEGYNLASYSTKVSPRV